MRFSLVMAPVSRGLFLFAKRNVTTGDLSILDALNFVLVLGLLFAMFNLDEGVVVILLRQCCRRDVTAINVRAGDVIFGLSLDATVGLL